MALEIPVVGVVSLEALVVAAGPAGATVLALRDARAGEAYFGLWKGIDEAPEPGAPLATPLHRLMKPTRGRAVDVMTALSERGIERVLAVGEDAERLAVTLPLQGCLAGVRTPDAGPEAVLSLALPRFAAGTVDDADALAPRYLQPSTPELRLKKGERRLGGEAV
jgi:tRNA A37 threonylcarbamoyladenosine modification protein TsaB